MLSPQSQDRFSRHPSLKSLSSPSASGIRAEVTKSMMEKTREPKQIYWWLELWNHRRKSKCSPQWGELIRLMTELNPEPVDRMRSCPPLLTSVLFISHSSVKVKLLSCPTLCNPMDCSLTGSSIHGIFQARILEWVAISFSRRSSQPRDWTWVSCVVGRRFTIWGTREVLFGPLESAFPLHYW